MDAKKKSNLTLDPEDKELLEQVKSLMEKEEGRMTGVRVFRRALRLLLKELSVHGGR